KSPPPTAPQIATPGVPPPAPAPEVPPPPSEEPGYFIVYFDQLQLTPVSVRRVAGDVQRLLAGPRIPPERVIVLRQDFDLMTEAQLGSTRKDVQAAIDRIAKAQTLGPLDVRFSLSRLQQLWEDAKERPDPCRVFVSGAKSEITAQMGLLARNSTTTFEHLRHTARLLAGLPGPKTLLFVADSLETHPAAELVRFALNACSAEPELVSLAQQGDAMQLERRLLEFAEEAN